MFPPTDATAAPKLSPANGVGLGMVSNASRVVESIRKTAPELPPVVSSPGVPATILFPKPATAAPNWSPEVALGLTRVLSTVPIEGARRSSSSCNRRAREINLPCAACLEAPRTADFKWSNLIMVARLMKYRPGMFLVGEIVARGDGQIETRKTDQSSSTIVPTARADKLEAFVMPSRIKLKDRFACLMRLERILTRTCCVVGPFGVKVNRVKKGR